MKFQFVFQDFWKILNKFQNLIKIFSLICHFSLLNFDQYNQWIAIFYSLLDIFNNFYNCCSCSRSFYNERFNIKYSWNFPRVLPPQAKICKEFQLSTKTENLWNLECFDFSGTMEKMKIFLILIFWKFGKMNVTNIFNKKSKPNILFPVEIVVKKNLISLQ